MVFASDTASDVSDLFSRLDTFLTVTASGWTDRLLTTSDTYGFARTGAPDPIEVQFQWDGGTPEYVGIFQSTGFVAVGTAPGSHTNDSGQGVQSSTNATIATGRNVRLVNSSMPYWFFEGGGAGLDYCHVAVQVNAGPPPQIVHFGFGNLNKRGTYTGGAYCYGFARSGSNSSGIMNDGSILLDGLATNAGSMGPYVATLHAEGLQNTVAAERWLLVWGDASSANQGTDRGGNDRHFCQGGFRGGLSARFFARPSAQSVAGNIPMYPIPLMYLDTVPATDEAFSLGSMPDVYGVNIENFTAGQEISEGGETYVLFPSWRNDPGAGNDTRQQGIAYRKESL